MKQLHATGHFRELKIRLLELHREGWTYPSIGGPLGLTPSRVKQMAQQADQGRS
jgi:hypothetical protein